MSMAAGEYVSVSSQSDTEQADLARERRELSENAPAELEELTGIYVKRGLYRDLAEQVARQLRGVKPGKDLPLLHLIAVVGVELGDGRADLEPDLREDARFDSAEPETRTGRFSTTRATVTSSGRNER